MVKAYVYGHYLCTDTCRSDQQEGLRIGDKFGRHVPKLQRAQEQGEAGGGGERRMVREPVARNRYTDACTSTYYIVLDTNTYK